MQGGRGSMAGDRVSEVFDAYALYYDLVYRDKDYAGEARYAHDLIQRHAPGSTTILELGCGTGAHAETLVGLGYTVTGIDRSAEMLARAVSRFAGPGDARKPRLMQADMRAFRTDERFDAVISLFHVFSYQLSNQDLQQSFATAAAHLRPGGVLLFDFWYGPAVLRDPPSVRVRRFESDGTRITRISEPAMFVESNTVSVDFEVFVERTGHCSKVKESHWMRYLFVPEIDRLLADTGFERAALLAWRKTEAPTVDDWYACVVARRSGPDGA